MKKATRSAFCTVLVMAAIYLAIGQCQAMTSGYSVAVLKDDVNGPLKAMIADKILPALNKNGFAAEYITYEDLCSEGGLDKYDCLVLTDSTRFPVAGRDNLLAFLKRGSDMVLLGGMAFKDNLWLIDNKWGTAKQHLQRMKNPDNVKSRKILFDFENVDWQKWKRGATKKENPSVLLSEKGLVGNCMKMEIKNISEWEWDNFISTVLEKIPASHNAFVFQARADAQTKHLVFEVIEKDGSRWISSVEITPDWKEYVVVLEDFKLFEQGSYGKQKDTELNVADINEISLGLAHGIKPHLPGDHTIWIDQFTTGVLELPFDKDIKPLGLPIFEGRDIYCYKDSPYITTYEKQDILKTRLKMPSCYAGISAIAFEYPEVSRYIPLLSVQDKYFRNVGFASGLIVNYAGDFKNSNWLLFGLDSTSFYCSNEFLGMTVELLTKMKKGELSAKFAEEDGINEKKCLSVVSPAPADFIKLSKDKKHFLLPDGRKFFALGCNYIGPFERKCEYGEDYFSSKRLEEDFKKAKDAGINAFRFWNFRIENYPERLKTIIELARKYQIYLILSPRSHPLPTDKELIEVFQKNAILLSNETIVLGYDLMNEPYVTTVGSISVNGERSEILKHNVYEKYSTGYFDKKWVDKLAQKRDWPELGDWIQGSDVLNLYAAHEIAKKYIEKYNPPQDYSCLYGFDGKLPIEADYKEFISALDKTFKDWILFHKEAIHQFDNNHFITVGYNTSLAALPANSLLDFISHHIYQMPYSYEDMQKSVTTFDRLRAFWPDKPITIGEFGFTSGLKLSDSTYLDPYTSSVAEMMVFLYAFSNDYSGAYLWMLSEWPIANIKYNAPWISPDRHIYESRFGMYSYDGTATGKPKPITHATKFFRKYIDTHEPGSGNLAIIQADTPVKTSYLFTDKDALFVGNTKYSSERLEFQNSFPVNVMLSWDAEQLKAVATADVEVTIDLSKFGFSNISDIKIDGPYDELVKVGSTVKLKLFEGQTVNFSW
ncbi:MAG: hypothetical protein JW912_00950 [Sedimentisphaerales bacterium]|nr:hypothetical protein [Sedimentisphaerales bacterium]